MSTVLKGVKELEKVSETEDEAVFRRAIQIIERLLHPKVPFCAQECIVICSNIFRSYGDKYHEVIDQIFLCTPRTIDNEEAKATIAWIIGEFSSKISNAADLIAALFLGNFLNEPQAVQLSILTDPANAESKKMLETIISLPINESDDPDLRDRGFLYLNLVNDMGEVARKVVAISLALTVSQMLDTPRDRPLAGTPASLYGRLPSEFVPQLQLKEVEELIEYEPPLLVANNSDVALEVSRFALRGNIVRFVAGTKQVLPIEATPPLMSPSPSPSKRPRTAPRTRPRSTSRSSAIGVRRSSLKCH
jgi:hypothetical protein